MIEIKIPPKIMHTKNEVPAQVPFSGSSLSGTSDSITPGFTSLDNSEGGM